MTNYANGADLERAAKKELEDNGYFVVRSAGSRSLVDLLALKPGEILMVQCKTDGYLQPAQRDDLRWSAARLAAVPLLARWWKPGRQARELRFFEVTEAGPEEWTPDYGLHAGHTHQCGCDTCLQPAAVSPGLPPC